MRRRIDLHAAVVPGDGERRLRLQIDVFLAAAFLMLISSCTSLPEIPSSPFRAAELDTAALRNKVIVIDPGHGGPYGGAVGTLGLKESEVNLGVALYLWGLLVNWFAPRAVR